MGEASERNIQNFRASAVERGACSVLSVTPIVIAPVAVLEHRATTVGSSLSSASLAWSMTQTESSGKRA